MDSGSSCQLGSSIGSSIGVRRGGLEGVVNGLPKPTTGIFGYQIVYGTKGDDVF